MSEHPAIDLVVSALKHVRANEGTDVAIDDADSPPRASSRGKGASTVRSPFWIAPDKRS
jgi:hypothetical protein